MISYSTDRAETRWGRPWPFLLLFSLPFGLSFLLLWWAPPWQSQLAPMTHVTLAFMVTDTRVLFNLLAPSATAASAACSPGGRGGPPDHASSWERGLGARSRSGR